MVDEGKLNQAINRQAQAETLMRIPILMEAFAELDKTYVEAWRSAIDQAAREQLWMAQSNLRKVRNHLAKVVADGKVAQAEIDQLTERKKRFGVI